MCSTSHMVNRGKNATGISVHWNELLPDCIFELLNPYASVHFVPMDFIFSLFISACGGLAQIAEIKIEGELKEPPLIWTNVLAPTGCRKSAALSEITKALRQVQSTLSANLQEQHGDRTTLLEATVDLYQKKKLHG